MTKVNQDIPARGERYFAGDTAVVEVTVRQDGSPKDLSNATITFALSRFRGDEPIIEKTLGNGVTITDALAGVLRIEIEGDETADLGEADGEDYHYEVAVRDNNSATATVTTGTWTIYDSTATVDP
jgi:Domain of unknown function (DUF2479).